MNISPKLNELNEDGIILFLKEIDECIRLFDKHELALHPRKSEKDEKTDSAAQLFFKLPPPPPPKSQPSFHPEKYVEKFHPKQCTADSRAPFQQRPHAETSYGPRHPNKIWFNKRFLKNY